MGAAHTGRRLAATMLGTLAALACDDPTGPDSRGPGIHVAAQSVLADTVGTSHRLVVAVVDSAGRPAVGRVVRFETAPPGVSSYSDVRLEVAHPDSTRTSLFLATPTDARGQAAARVHLAFKAGPAKLVVSVPELGFVDTVHYTVQPGQLATITVAPRDTAVYVGTSYTLRASPVDAYGNPLPGAVTFAAVAGPVTVNSSSGAVSVSAIGRGIVQLAAGARRDTAYVSVVPQGWVASVPFYPGNGGPLGIDLIQLDGSGRQRIGPGIENVFVTHGFSWSPDGQYLAIASGPFVSLLRPGEVMRPILEMPGDLVKGTRFSPDGQWIYFAQGSGGSSAWPGGMYRVHPDGSGLEHVGSVGQSYHPSPSHDGRSVAYVSYDSPCGIGKCIHVLDLATGTPREYGTRPYLAPGRLAAWSPTEDLIAYDSESALMLVRSDGTGERMLASDVSHVKWMDWSPDGRWLVVAEDGVTLFEVATGLRLPLGQFVAFGPTAWRP